MFSSLHASYQHSDVSSRSFDNGDTWAIAGPLYHHSVDNLNGNPKIFGLNSSLCSFDSLKVAVSHPEFRDSGGVGGNNLQSPQEIFSSLPIIGNATLPSQRPNVMLPDTYDKPSFHGINLPELQPFQYAQAAPAPGFGNPTVVNTPDVPTHEQNDGERTHLHASVWASPIPSPLVARSERREGNPDSDRSSTPGACPFCKRFRGDAKRIREHLRCHIREHVCEVVECSRQFSTARDLQRHDKAAHRKESLTCYFCAASIRGGRMDNLQRHIRQRHASEAMNGLT
ncbi:hypothetical protein CORC01_07354 [Colletotrichum orchidophilum]|uniref:C2H2-type domain-containing protein n=1 Tax=Colletotrichum orchidophilum TaxID=1209926 RepID=A0A1G4B776_9PEZI|nr:uncharacterized protein CORC01_07354 [Colletotrichum orchidophilum]OHE97299.1 hypothetical protein CORC01_07354 [Colletotrichum orchidophilum]